MSEREIELQRKLDEAEVRAEQVRRQLHEAEKRAEEAEKRTEKAEKRTEKTTLDEDLRDCHNHVFRALRIADKSLTSTGGSTNVHRKRYPMWLRPWSDFADLQRDHFDIIKRGLGDRRLFPESIATRDKANDVCWRPMAVEKDIDKYESIAVD